MYLFMCRCFACKCDPFLSNSLTSLNKEKSSKRRGMHIPLFMFMDLQVYVVYCISLFVCLC